MRLFLLLRLGTLDLCRAAESLLSVLALLACWGVLLAHLAGPGAQFVSQHSSKHGECKRTLLSAGTLGLGGHADTDQAVGRLELLHGLGGVIDESEAGGLATTELSSETEDGDLVLLGLVERTELLTELLLGDVGTARVEDVTVKTHRRSAHQFPTSKI